MKTLLFTNSCLHRKDTTHLKFSPGTQDVLRLPVVRINMGCRPSPSPPGIKMSTKKVKFEIKIDVSEIDC